MPVNRVRAIQEESQVGHKDHYLADGNVTSAREAGGLWAAKDLLQVEYASGVQSQTSSAVWAFRPASNLERTGLGQLPELELGQDILLATVFFEHGVCKAFGWAEPNLLKVPASDNP